MSSDCGAHAGKTAKVRNWCRKPLMVIGATSIGFLASLMLLELLLRIHNPIPLTLRANKIVLPTNSRFVHRNVGNKKADAVVYNTYNGLGLRGPEKPTSFDDHLTIVTVGGSTTACVGLTDGRTWPDRLGHTLGQEFEQVLGEQRGNGRSFDLRASFSSASIPV